MQLRTGLFLRQFFAFFDEVNEVVEAVYLFFPEVHMLQQAVPLGGQKLKLFACLPAFPAVKIFLNSLPVKSRRLKVEYEVGRRYFILHSSLTPFDL